MTKKNDKEIEEGIKQITRIKIAEDYVTNFIKEHTQQVEMNHQGYYETVLMWNIPLLNGIHL